MSIEPTANRRGLAEMAMLLIAAHGLAAQLAAARLDAASGRPATNDAVRAWLQAHLGRTQGGEGAEPPSGPLTSATLAVVEAAERYRRAARVETTDEL